MEKAQQSASIADSEFLPERLTVARERVGWTKAELADACGVTRRTVSDWEAGRVVRPPVEQIADVLDFPVGFFGVEPVDQVDVEHVSFRALTSLSARELKSTIAAATITGSLARWIDENYATPEVDIPWLDQLIPPVSPGDPNPIQAAASLRRIWNIGDRPIPNMMSLLESRGVRIFSLSPDVREVDAFSLWLSERPTIFVNPDKSGERLRFDLAHELGHLVMHRAVVTAGRRECEISANSFAGSFLMPAAKLMAIVGRNVSLTTVFELKRLFRVSATSMVFRLHELKLINDWKYRNWMSDLSGRGFRRSEPDGIPSEKSELLTQIVRLAREDGLPIARLADNLHIPARDVRAALGGLTLVSMS
ncbi:XRE family transcriptional regulator [Microlunatus elymi]|nr:XRE family transcriptional regulator [Microlunatus elymi]